MSQVENSTADLKWHSVVNPGTVKLLYKITFKLQVYSVHEANTFSVQIWVPSAMYLILYVQIWQLLKSKTLLISSMQIKVSNQNPIFIHPSHKAFNPYNFHVGFELSNGKWGCQCELKGNTTPSPIFFCPRTFFSFPQQVRDCWQGFFCICKLIICICEN